MTIKMVQSNTDILGLGFSSIDLNFVFTSFITGKLAFLPLFTSIMVNLDDNFLFVQIIQLVVQLLD